MKTYLQREQQRAAGSAHALWFTAVYISHAKFKQSYNIAVFL